MRFLSLITSSVLMLALLRPACAVEPPSPKSEDILDSNRLWTSPLTRVSPSDSTYPPARFSDPRLKEPAKLAWPVDASKDSGFLVPNPLTLEEALRLGRERNPALLSALSDVRRTYWAYQQASSFPSATVQLTGTAGSGPTSLNSYSGLSRDAYVQILQNFYPLGSFATQRKIAVLDFNAYRALARVAEIDMNQSIKDAFYTLLAAQDKERVARSNLQLANNIYAKAEVRFTTGAGPKLDLINSEVERNRAKQSLVLAQANTVQAQAKLAPLLGLSARHQIIVKGQLAAPPRKLIFEALYALSENSPRAMAARESLSKAKEQVRLSRQQGNITPGLQAVYDIQNPSYLVGATLSIPIDWGYIRNDVRQKEELALQQATVLSSTLLDISSNLRTAFSQYEANSRNAVIYITDVLLPLEQAASITSYGFERGAIPYTQVLLTEQQLMQTRNEFIDVQLSVQIALDALEHAVGGSLEAAGNEEHGNSDLNLPSDGEAHLR